MDVCFSQVQIDSAVIESTAYESRKFENLKAKYSDSDFNYIEKSLRNIFKYTEIEVIISK